MTDEDWREHQVSRFNHSEYARLLGMVVTKTWETGARVEMDPAGKRNPNDVIHGGAIFSLADHAFGLAANLSRVQSVAVTAHITYLAPAGGGRLAAVAEFAGCDDRHVLFTVTVTEGDREIARFDGVGITIPEGRDRRKEREG